MSPWGKFYLENVDYHPEWFTPFESWRMHWMLDQIKQRFGYNQVARHLDVLDDILREDGDCRVKRS
jgi:hypothetical protein